MNLAFFMRVIPSCLLLFRYNHNIIDRYSPVGSLKDRCNKLIGGFTLPWRRIFLPFGRIDINFFQLPGRKSGAFVSGERLLAQHPHGYSPLSGKLEPDLESCFFALIELVNGSSGKFHIMGFAVRIGADFK